MSYRLRLAQWLAGPRWKLAAVNFTGVRDDRGWNYWAGRPHDRPDQYQLYNDTLEAWRKNPIAKRIIDAITDYVVGDGLTPVAEGEIGQFTNEFWNHPENQMPLRVPDLVDELSRAGNLLITLHRDPNTGMSYVRPIPTDSVVSAEYAKGDWEKIISVTFRIDQQTLTLPTPAGATAESQAIALLYGVNKPIAASMGESDLATLAPWLLRYSRMLEDRVRLNWAVRAFLWFVSVPEHQVEAKREQYRTPPESGSIVVHDQAEQWEVKAPNLNAHDAREDLKAVRMMIDAGSAIPPHWRGEATDINLATAQAMNAPAGRHLRRRQLYVREMLIDICNQAYARAFAAGMVTEPPNVKAITITVPDVTRDDNNTLGEAAARLASALASISAMLPENAPRAEFAKYALKIVSKFAGEPASDETINQVIGGLK